MFAAIRKYGTSKFDQVLTSNGGQTISSASSYWTSTETNYEWVVVVDRQGSVYTNAGKGNNYRVRAIRKVTFD